MVTPFLCISIFVPSLYAHSPVADPRVRRGRAPCPNSFIFMQFSAKKLQNNTLAHSPRELVPPPLEILDPPLLT